MFYFQQQLLLPSPLPPSPLSLIDARRKKKGKKKQKKKLKLRRRTLKQIQISLIDLLRQITGLQGPTLLRKGETGAFAREGTAGEGGEHEEFFFVEGVVVTNYF